jgi:GNAT superfamily N-acetyltransferase
MPETVIVEFADGLLEGAGALLAQRHRRHRLAEPLLPKRFEEVRSATAEIEDVWRREGTSGAAAVSNGRCVGYLVGAPRRDAVWGESVWVERAGHAVADAEVVRDLYAVAAEQWVAAGLVRHYTVVPGADTTLAEAWFRLGFGQQQVYGVREAPSQAAPTAPPGVDLREADIGDLDVAVALEATLAEHQRLAPVFARNPLPSEEEIRGDWSATLSDPECACFIAERAGRDVGIAAAYPAERSDRRRGLGTPDRSCVLGFAATVPEARGAGVGVALTAAVFGWARGRGHAAITTDWRATNLLAARFWPRRGFRPAFLRLHRSIP